jgi:hypothetical protein
VEDAWKEGLCSVILKAPSNLLAGEYHMAVVKQFAKRLENRKNALCWTTLSILGTPIFHNATKDTDGCQWNGYRFTVFASHRKVTCERG